MIGNWGNWRGATEDEPSAGPAAGGGMRDPWTTAWQDPRMQPFKDKLGAMQDRAREFHTGMQGARDQYHTDMDTWRQGLPAALGFAPRPGGTAGGGMAWDPSKMNLGALRMPHFQMPQGFAAQLPWGRSPAAPSGATTQPAPTTSTPAQGVAQGEPNPTAPEPPKPGNYPIPTGAQPTGGPGKPSNPMDWGNWGMRNAGAADAINKLASANNLAAQQANARNALGSAPPVPGAGGSVRKTRWG